MWGTSDARWGCQKRGAVQLCELRSAGAIGSSVATDPQDCGRGAGGSVGGIREAVRQVRTALDCSGETASRAVVASVGSDWRRRGVGNPGEWQIARAVGRKVVLRGEWRLVRRSGSRRRRYRVWHDDGNRATAPFIITKA